MKHACTENPNHLNQKIQGKIESDDKWTLNSWVINFKQFLYGNCFHNTSWCRVFLCNSRQVSALLIMKRVIFLALRCLQRKGKHWCILVISRVCSFPGCITPVYAAICLRSRCILLSEFCVLVVSCHCVSRPFAWDHDAFCNLYSVFFILYSGYIAPLYAAICNCSNPIPYRGARWMEGCISGRYI